MTHKLIKDNIQDGTDNLEFYYAWCDYYNYYALRGNRRLRTGLARMNLIRTACHRNQLTVKIEQKFSLTRDKVRMELSCKVLKREFLKSFVLKFLESLNEPRYSDLSMLRIHCQNSKFKH
jgi:hypothetical protein